MDARWSIAIHGGAGTILREKLGEAQRNDHETALGAALDAGATLLASGGIHPVLDTVYPLEDTAAAVEHIGAGRARGKVVVTP